MSRNFIRSIVLPLLLWLITSGLLILWSPDPYQILSTAYVLMGLSFLCTVWITAAAQWLYQRHQWKNIAYIVANFTWSGLYVGIGFALALSMRTFNQELASLLFLAGIILAILRFLLSILQRLRQGRRVTYTNRYWQVATGNSRFWRFWCWWSGAVGNHFLRIEESAPPIAANSKAISRGTLRWRRLRLPADEKFIKPSPIPPREQIIPAQTSKPAPVVKQKPSDVGQLQTQPAAVATQPDQSVSFVEQAIQLAGRHETATSHVPFTQERPTYAQMSVEQQRWYFYWRSELRSGNFLPADLSYLLVYIYECLNVVGFANPQSAFEQLTALWKHYRTMHPKLDNNLIDWVADFSVIHRLSTTPLTWYNQVSNETGEITDIDLYVEAWLLANSNWHTFSTNVLYRLSDFSPKRSKFRKLLQQELDLDVAYKKGIQAVDQFLQQSQGLSFFAFHAPSTTRSIQRVPFTHAYHKYDPKMITIAQIRPWLGQQQLRKHLKSIIKQSENILRDQKQFETKLLGIELPTAWVQAIQQAFAVPAAKRTVTIDFAEVAELQRESAEIRQRLTLKDEALDRLSPLLNQAAIIPSTEEPVDEVIDAEPVIMAASPAKVQTGESHLAPYLQRPANTPPHLLTDLVEIAAILGEAQSQEAALLHFFYQQAWKVAPTTLTERYQRQFVNATLDRLNERALSQLGDALFFEEDGFWTVAEDYRDEISYIFDHIAYPTFVSQQPATSNGVAFTHQAQQSSNALLTADADAIIALPTEWMDLGQALQTDHKAALSILLDGDQVAKRLDTLARAKQITANQLIDQINEIALETVNDNIIRTSHAAPAIEEEYVGSLRQLFGD